VAPAPSAPPPATSAAVPPAAKPPAPGEPKDVYREVAETVVFVVVLVLLLKTFIAEAFVIPTGSMATTLWGYQKYVECPNCGYSFPVNCSSEADPQVGSNRSIVSHCQCPNCRYEITLLGEREGDCIAVRKDALTIEFNEWMGWLNWQPRKPEFTVDANTKITVDGKEKGIDDIRAGMRARVIFDQRSLRALSIAARWEGSFGPQPTTVSEGDKLMVLDPGYHSGDRVLVFKALYDSGFLRDPHRHDVVVFKFPVEPQTNHTAMNYIKRLIGLPGETIAICQGQLYVWPGPRANPPAPPTRPDPTPDDPNRVVPVFWAAYKMGNYDWPNDPEAEDVWKSDREKETKHFEIIRKSPDLILALSRIVYDNDYLPDASRKAEFPPRWTGEGSWQGEGDGAMPKSFRHAGGASFDWLRYRHLVHGEGKPPELITDFMGYNTGDGSSGMNWVGNLILECEVQIDKADANGELRLELSRGVDRFQARFNLQTGECTLFRLDKAWNDKEKAKELQIDGQPAARPTPLKQGGKHHIRFANVDERLTLWVDDTLPFGDGVAYDAPSQAGPTDNDLKPANIGVQGATVSVSHIKLWRDTYYTSNVTGNVLQPDALADPARWGDLRKPAPRFMYVQQSPERHYICLGDNSPASADSRTWGMVPERLMLGRALVVYYPFKFNAWPLNAPVNRIGPIR
jgi:signal peptidase I